MKKLQIGNKNFYTAHVGVYQVWWSYQTPVAFRNGATGELVIRENDWGVTTGTHLNLIDRDHDIRISGEEFEARFQEEIEPLT